MHIVIATVKSWNISNAELFAKKYAGQHQIKIVTSKNDLEKATESSFKPDYIFFPHWSYYIPPDIYENYNCIVFHMTDLPYGRGGSPLQNLIIRGHKETKISAIKVEKEVDAGPIYLKHELKLDGTAEEIFKRASDIIFDEMIPCFLTENLTAKEQTGEIVTFQRRTPDESALNPDMTIEEMYDHIRMLDAEGYPNAYIDYGNYKISFTGVIEDGDGLTARVLISKKDI